MFFSREEEAQVKRIKSAAKQRSDEERADNERLSSKVALLPVFKRAAGSDHSARVDLHLKNFDISVAGRELISSATVTLSSGRRYGLVGRNGAGKTTLLRYISARELPGIPSHINILHVEQEATGDDQTVIAYVLAADVEREELLKEEKSLNTQSEVETDADKASALQQQLQKVYERMKEIDTDGAEARAAEILSGLGFDDTKQHRATREFSGGWRMRMALSRALFCKPDLLLLDEPTNMLDIGAVVWLADYLANVWEGTILVVSHDRTFLNNVITDIIHLERVEKNLVPYKGDYETFERTRLEKLTAAAKNREAQEKQRKHVQGFIDKFRYNAKRASLVQSRIKALKKMELIPALLDDPTASFSFPLLTDDQLAPPIIQFINISFAYPASPPSNLPLSIFENISLDFDLDSRVALVGANGQGKTTLLKLITSQLEPTNSNSNTSKILKNSRLRFAVFSQHHIDQLNMELSPLEFFAENFPGCPAQQYRAHLGKYGISGDLALQSIETLSGGQKSRVAFAMMGWVKPHFLVLDEPTNHLDVETVDVLAQALNEFDGGVVLVSHDERLISLVCNEMWVVGDGGVEKWEGDFEEYKNMIMKQMRNDQQKAKSGGGGGGGPSSSGSSSSNGGGGTTQKAKGALGGEGGGGGRGGKKKK